MKRVFAALAACIVALALSACAAQPIAPVTPASAAAAIAAAKTTIGNQCVALGPLLSSATIMNASNPAAVADLNTASDAFGKVCVLAASTPTIQASFTVGDLSTAINAGVPALLRAIGTSTLTPQNKTAAQLAITAAQLALSEALESYDQNTVIVPASAGLVA